MLTMAVTEEERSVEGEMSVVTKKNSVVFNAMTTLMKNGIHTASSKQTRAYNIKARN